MPVPPMSEAAGRTNLLGMTRPELEAFVGGFGAKPYRARQLLKWIYRRGESDFARMTDLAKDFRAELAGRAEVTVPEIVAARAASDGTRKWLLRMPGAAGNEQVIETVFIPEPGRGTLCISSQIGCALDCSFCATGAQGFNRNLTAAEIIGQVWLANRELGYDPDGERIVTNVVLMGMGEPLANYRNVLPAMQLMLDDLGYDLSRRRVTLSTSGLVPQIYRLAEDCNVALAVSLHAPNDAPARRARADQPQAPDRRAARRLLALPRAAERPQRHLRVHDAGRRQRPARARAGTRAAAARSSREGQPDSVQHFSRHEVPPFARRGDPAVSRPAGAGRRHGDSSQDPRRRHRCGLRPAARAGSRPHAGPAREQARRARGAGMSARAAVFALALLACGAGPAAEPGSRTPTLEAGRINARLAMEYLKRDQLQVAQEKIEKALVQNPNDVNVQLAAGLVYERLHENKIAEKHFRLGAQGRARQPGGAERARRLPLPQQAAGQGRGDVRESGGQPALPHAVRRLHQRGRLRAQRRRTSSARSVTCARR